MSGYKYIMKEAQVMNALSIFMGVRREDILLDETPANTYEMVLDLRALMEGRGWGKAILISSPYHMRRLKLLCDRHLRGAVVYLVPVERSSFYSHKSGASINQVRGIIQEYLAILYYMLKGYL